MNLVIEDFPLPSPSESGICLTKRSAEILRPPHSAKLTFLTRAQTLPSYPSLAQSFLSYLSSASELPAVTAANVFSLVAYEEM